MNNRIPDKICIILLGGNTSHEPRMRNLKASEVFENNPKTKPAEFEVDIQSEVTYFAVEKQLSEKIKSFARRRGVSPDTLLNLWGQP